MKLQLIKYLNSFLYNNIIKMTNTLIWNTWKENTGNYNNGNRNIGYLNSGNRNIGYLNSGDRNIGDCNHGSLNNGDWNIGDYNIGKLNIGNRNIGNRNSGNRNSGYLNSDTPTVRIFNKDTGISYDDFNTNIFPKFFYFDCFTTEWVSKENMTDEEKQENPWYDVVWWYIKKLIPKMNTKESKKEYMHKAWRASWDKATDEDRRRVYDIPNWDNEIFKQISGIDVDKELNAQTIEMVSWQVIEVKFWWTTYKAIIQ